MKRLGLWIGNLTTVSKTSILVSLLLGVLFTTSALPPTLAPVTSAPALNSSTVQTKKQPVVITKTETQTEPIPFDTLSVESNTIVQGVTEVQTTGVVGEKCITHVITLTDGVETERKSTEAVSAVPVAEVVATGTYVKPVSSCDTNYSGCVPIVSYDLDCKDIGFQVTVLGDDTHRFDRDGDGSGCESY